MTTLKKISVALALIGLAGFAGAEGIGNDDGATQQLSGNTSGAHSTESTDRGGKTANDTDMTFEALLEWLLGHKDR